MNGKKINASPTVSVIIPCYNAEKYLSRCLNSVFNQSFDDFEIICIDDGSKDETLKILDDFRNKYPAKMKTYAQTNGGPGLARNKGLMHAIGHYIAFIDADDSVSPNYFKNLVNAASATDADIIIGGHLRINKSGKVAKKICFSKNCPFYKFTCPTPWGRLYKADFLFKYDLKFPDCDAEDILFNFDCYSKNPKIHFINNTDYKYIENSYSLTHTLPKYTDPIVLPSYFSKLATFNLPDEDEGNYFIVRQLISDLLTKGHMSTPCCFLNATNIYFTFANANSLLEGKYLKSRPKGELFSHYFIIRAFIYLRQHGLLKLFAKFYCRPLTQKSTK